MRLQYSDMYCLREERASIGHIASSPALAALFCILGVCALFIFILVLILSSFVRVAGVHERLHQFVSLSLELHSRLFDDRLHLFRSVFPHRPQPFRFFQLVFALKLFLLKKSKFSNLDISGVQQPHVIHLFALQNRLCSRQGRLKYFKINKSYSSPYFDILESLSFQVRHVVLLVALRVVALVESEGSECGVVEELVEAGQGVELSLQRHNANQLLHFFHQIRRHWHLKIILFRLNFDFLHYSLILLYFLPFFLENSVRKRKEGEQYNDSEFQLSYLIDVISRLQIEEGIGKKDAETTVVQSGLAVCLN